MCNNGFVSFSSFFYFRFIFFLLFFVLSSCSDAPVFAGNLQNATLLQEIATGSSRNLTCTVVDSPSPLPLSLHLTTERNPVPHVKNMTTPSSITVIIANASQSDATDYVCYACNGNDTKYCSYLGFDTYVGGKKPMDHAYCFLPWA